ncbi:MAG: sulfite oxidase-like oxidoreductase [Chloroflexi bacterium]|nr:sulfite oxidase-like oxidoreductase [Chloroflexota bacterium]
MSLGDNSGKDKEVIKSSDTERANRIPPGQSLTEKWPVLHYGSIPRTDPSQWKFTISGLVEKQQEITYAEFIALPQVKVFSDIHCVTRWSKLNNLWEGVSTGAIRQLARLKPEAKFVTVHAFGGFTTNLSVDDFFESDVLFALKYNDKPLPLEHGYPVRLIVPRLYFWKSAKWVTDVQFTKEDIPGFWELNGYHNHGDPWQEERYS